MACKTLFLNAVSLVMENPILRHDGPSTMLATVNEQTDQNRWIVHLLHYIPERRSQEIDIIEDVIPLYHIGLTVRVPHTMETVRCVPQNEDIDFIIEDGCVCTVPKLEGHQMIELAC